MRYKYAFNCTELKKRDVQKLIDMVDNAKSITYTTFRRHCTDVKDIAKDLGYNCGLKLQDDPYVSFYKSTFGDKPCYFFVWSAMEFIWLKD